MGSRNDIETIASYLRKSPERQTFLFSATISSAIESIAKSTLSRSHQYINCVSADNSTVHAHIPQFHTVLASGEQSLPHLLRLDQLARKMEAGKSKIIVFFSTTKMVQMFAEMVRMSVNALPCVHFPETSVYEIHSKRHMDRRISTSCAFRRDEAQGSVLITSDVSVRGVDYPGVTRVIQMGRLPASKDMYVHRVGRTGRGGKRDGRGDLVISPWEMGILQKKMEDVGLMPVTVEDLLTAPHSKTGAKSDGKFFIGVRLPE